MISCGTKTYVVSWPVYILACLQVSETWTPIYLPPHSALLTRRSVAWTHAQEPLVTWQGPFFSFFSGAECGSETGT